MIVAPIGVVAQVIESAPIEQVDVTSSGYLSGEILSYFVSHITGMIRQYIMNFIAKYAGLPRLWS
jgi:hypothetical protein